MRTALLYWIAFSLPLSSVFCATGSGKPNVLFIAIDDLRPELGCYGSEIAITPHIDRLSAKGVRFENAYCQLAVCNPSRVSLLTGLRPDSTRVWTLDVRFRETIPGAITLPQHFKQNGYRTEGYGKIFHNPWPDNISWSRPHSWPENSRLWSEQARTELRDFKSRLKAKGTPQNRIDRLRATAVERVDIPDHEHIDGAIAMQAIRAMKRLAQKDEPFFLAAGFVRPHLPFVVPEKYWKLYDPAQIPLATNASLPENTPDYAMNTMYELRDYFDYLDTPDPRSGSLTEAQQRELKHGYLASVSFIDTQVGLLLGELDRLDLADETIVVLWSDHGFKLGEHNSWCKQTNYEIDTRVPLLIYDPGSAGNGRASESLVELVDIYPTLCDLAGLKIPDELEGVSLKPVLKNPDRTVKTAAVSQFLRRQKNRELMGYAYRTKRWRYIEWLDRKTGGTVDRELFDHAADSSESVSIAGDAENAALLDRLGSELRAMLPRPLAADQAGTTRPGITFQNDGNSLLTVYWLPGKGQPREVGTIQPGRSLTRKTTMGHRFRVVGQGIRETHTVEKTKETVRIARRGEKLTNPDAPNIVVIIGDDWSWPHASILGDKTVNTPTFDRIAREGILFENAFVSSPSCTPSRFAIATGQYHWRLGEGANLGGSLGKDVPVYPELLAETGYRTGFSRKGAAPSPHSFRGSDPFGERYGSFDDFLRDQSSDQPFCFWYGAGEPHRAYEWQASRESGLDLNSVEVPPFLPDNTTTRTDLGDYYLKVEQLDRFAGDILEQLDRSGELENTIVVMTSDNGMPFPRAKATLYDSGTRVPLAIRWGKGIRSGGKIDSFVSLTDLAPTFLEAAGVPVPDSMTGRSLVPLWMTQQGEQRRNHRDHVVTGMEKHVYPHPARSIRTTNFLYIRNFSPGQWPTGEPEGGAPVFDFAETPWPTVKGAFSHNIDPGPTKQWMRLHETAQNRQAFDRRPHEELYDLREDPHQINNLLASGETVETLEATRRSLADRLAKELRESGDPRFQLALHSTFAVRGWTVHLHDELFARSPGATRRMLDILDGQLQRVIEVVPPTALSQLREIPIWINPPYEGKRGTAEYHPQRKWLEDNGREPRMTAAIEITNVNRFPFENRRMPYLLLHELAHGYHHRIVDNGYGNREIRAAYQRAVESGDYDDVPRFDGNRTIRDKAYGMSSPMEYFAESTEAYFGKNDFFPFDRTELLEHDPAMHDLVKQLWEQPIP